MIQNSYIIFNLSEGVPNIKHKDIVYFSRIIHVPLKCYGTEKQTEIEEAEAGK